MFAKEEQGSGMVEYALIISGIALGAFAAVMSFGTGVLELYENTIERLEW